MSEIKRKVANQLYVAFEKLGAPPDLLSIVGSYGDTLYDEEILALLIDWNMAGKIMSPTPAPTGSET